jgi:2-succinyl-6-hydroxy-2,4-cyclohexadiene-1-carboxylate synthase
MTFLLLHGFTGTPASFDAIVDALPRHERVLRPAISGHGTNVSIATGFVEEVARLARFVRAEEAASLHVAGYSLGARLALGFSLEHPELVRRLTLIAPSAGLSDPEVRHDRAVADDSLAALLRCQGLAPFLERWEAQPLFASQRLLPAEARAKKFVERSSHDPDALAASLAALSKGRMPSYWERLGELRMPVTLVVGALDTKFVSEARAMKERIPQAELFLVPDAGHDVVLERPAELSAILNGDLA